MSEIKIQGNDLILPTTKRKLKPILSHNRLKRNNTLVKSTKYNYRLFHKSLSKGDLSVSLFQGNDVDLVRNLDLYQERNIWNNFKLKGQLKNELIKGKDYAFRITKRKDNDLNLPKLNSLTINGILESEQKLNQNKKEAQKNLAYSQLETELCSELKKLRQSYKEKKEEKDNIYKNFKKLNDEIDKITLEIQVMNSREAYENSKDKKMKQKELEKIDETIEKNKIKNNTENALNDGKEKQDNEKNENRKNNNDAAQNKMLKLKNMYQLKKEQDYQKKLTYDKLNTLKRRLSNINSPLIKLNQEIFEIKKQQSIVIHKLMAHYEALLYKGEEVRNEGLIWIIKAIWNLGENVPMSFIPPFLDFQSIEFLFQYAHKSIELDNVKKILNELKNELQAKIHKLFYTSKSPGRYSSSFEFKTDLIKRNTISQRSIKEHNFINAYIGSDTDEENKNVSSLKEMENIIGSKKNIINLKKLQGIDRIEELKAKIKSIEKEIFNLKKKETLRLFKEFVENDYANKYHVSIDMVLAALFGEHNKNIEINKYSKYKKEYLEELKNIRFYQYGHDKSSS